MYRFSSIFFVSLFIAASVTAAPPERPADGIAESLSPSSLSWAIQTPYQDVHLRVSGPDGIVFEGSYGAGFPVVYDFVDQMGNRLPDGQYAYEIIVTPLLDSALRHQIRLLRDIHDPQIEREVEAAFPSHLHQRSGFFRILDGEAVPRDLIEEAHNADSQFPEAVSGDGPIFQQATVLSNDDGVIRNSLCVGVDCPNDPTFSFATILLSENNTRIKFDDTSAVSGFPDRDWQLAANDSASGGANRFYLEDCGVGSGGACSGNIPFWVGADAPNNALVVDSSGRLGLGTATPVLDIHRASGNTPTLRLDQTGASGFTPQVWDVAGNEANFFIRDVTTGSRLPFRIRPGAPTSSIDISSAGNVGIGTASPQRQMHISGSGAAFRIDRSADTAAFILVRTNLAGTPLKTFVLGANASGANSGEFIINDLGTEVGGAGARRMTITNAGETHFTGAVQAPAFVQASSIRFKEQVEGLQDALGAVGRLQGVRFAWKETGNPSVGLIAEKVAEVMPEVVHRDDQDRPSGVNYGSLVAVLVEAVKSQQQQIQSLQTRLAALEARSGTSD